MTHTPKSPAMDALRKRSKKEDWDGYLTAAEIIDECFKSFCDHIAKLEADNAELNEALEELLEASRGGVSEWVRRHDAVTADRDALRNELEAARKQLAIVRQCTPAPLTAEELRTDIGYFVHSAPTGVKTGVGDEQKPGL